MSRCEVRQYTRFDASYLARKINSPW